MRTQTVGCGWWKRMVLGVTLLAALGIGAVACETVYESHRRDDGPYRYDGWRYRYERDHGYYRYDGRWRRPPDWDRRPPRVLVPPPRLPGPPRGERERRGEHRPPNGPIGHEQGPGGMPDRR